METSVAGNTGCENLASAVARIYSHLDAGKVGNQVVRALTEDFGARCAALWLADNTNNSSGCVEALDCAGSGVPLHLKAWSGLEDASIFAYNVHCPCNKSGGQPAVDASCIPDGIWSSMPVVADPVRLKADGVTSSAGFRLMDGDRLAGMVAYFGAAPLDDGLRSMLSLLAGHCVIALTNACKHQQLHGAVERLRALIDGAIDSVFILGADGRILFTNRSACRHLGYGRAELEKLGFSSLDPVSFGRLRGSYAEMLSGETVTYPAIFMSKSGEPMPVEIRAGAAIFDGDTVIQAFVRDTRERMAQERQKADLVAMITHDLKGPLTVIQGYSEVIADQFPAGSLPGLVEEGMTAIRTASVKLRSMIEDYLSLSRMESGMLKMEKTLTPVCSLITNAVESVRFSADVKKLALKVGCVDERLIINADPRLMDRAVTNLMLNAVNYTPRGGTICVGCTTAMDNGRIEISVSDTGVGIPADELHMVFDKFYRSSTGGGKGTGLGLAIVKSVAEAHGGEVTVESVEGKGSTFKLTLPSR